MKAPACLLITHRRPQKTSQALKAIHNAGFKGRLYLFADGQQEEWPQHIKNAHRDNCLLLQEEASKSGAVLEILEQCKGPRQGPVHAINTVLAQEEKIHIIEDDILVHPKFFQIHSRALEEFENHPALWLAEGHPLPDCPRAWLETRMARLVAWSTWSRKAKPFLQKTDPPFPWRHNRRNILAGLHPKTQLHLWKEFEILEANPGWSWHYPILQHQLLEGKTGLTPTTRLHTNIGKDGSGATCQNMLGATETWSEPAIQAWLSKKGAARMPRWEQSMEIQRYGRITQAIARKLHKMTPGPWKKIWTKHKP
jgi:hypothetical protein